MPSKQKFEPLFDKDDNFFDHPFAKTSADEYINAYKEAGDILADVIIERFNDKNYSGKNSIIFPCVFNYRHHLELFLKELIRKGYRLTDIDKKVPTHHHLNLLWEVNLKEIFKEMGEDVSDKYYETEEATGAFKELEEIDKFADAFRFSVKKVKKKVYAPSFSGRTVAIDIKRFRRKVTRISRVLEGIDYWFDDMYDSLMSNMEQA